MIIHLKGEVYELKQAESDYLNLQAQVHLLDERMRRLLADKDAALHQYDQKLNGQDNTLRAHQDKLEELKRLIGNQDTQNKELYDKLIAIKGKIGESETEYP